MGWTDLFKSKTIRLKPDPTVRWFGKLPTYADYYSSRTDEEWAVEFNNWVLKGYEIYQSHSRSQDHHHRRLPISAIVLRLPKSGMTAIATIQDYGGDMRGRPFPMCFYAGVPSHQWSGPTSDQLACAAQVLRDLTVLKREVPRFLNSPGRFESIFGDREVILDGLDGQSADDTWVRQAEQIALAEWFSAARGGLKIKDADAWFESAARWGDNIAQLESKTFEPTLRFPLARGIPPAVQISGWLRWLESRMDLRQRFLSLILVEELETGTGCLSVIAREPAPEDFLLATDLAGSLPYVDDLALVAPSGESDETAPSDAVDAAAVFQSVTTWARFVASPATVS